MTMLAEEQKQRAGVKNYLTLEEAADLLNVKVSAVRYKAVDRKDYAIKRVRFPGERGAPRIMINPYSFAEEHPETRKKLVKKGYMVDEGNGSGGLLTGVVDGVTNIVKTDDPEFRALNPDEQEEQLREQLEEDVPKGVAHDVKKLLVELNSLERQQNDLMEQQDDIVRKQDDIMTQTKDVKGKIIELLS